MNEYQMKSIDMIHQKSGGKMKIIKYKKKKTRDHYCNSLKLKFTVSSSKAVSIRHKNTKF